MENGGNDAAQKYFKKNNAYTIENTVDYTSYAI